MRVVIHHCYNSLLYTIYHIPHNTYLKTIVRLLLSSSPLIKPRRLYPNNLAPTPSSPPNTSIPTHHIYYQSPLSFPHEPHVPNSAAQSLSHHSLLHPIYAQSPKQPSPSLSLPAQHALLTPPSPFPPIPRNMPSIPEPPLFFHFVSLSPRTNIQYILRCSPPNRPMLTHVRTHGKVDPSRTNIYLLA